MNYSLCGLFAFFLLQWQSKFTDIKQSCGFLESDLTRLIILILKGHM